MSNLSAKNVIRATFTFEVEALEVPNNDYGLSRGKGYKDETSNIAYDLSRMLTRMWREAFRYGDASGLALIQVVALEGAFQHRGHCGIDSSTRTTRGSWESLHFTGRIRVRLVTRQCSAVIATFQKVAQDVFGMRVHTAPSAQLMRGSPCFRPTTIWRQDQVDPKRLEAQAEWAKLKRSTPRYMLPGFLRPAPRPPCYKAWWA